MSQEQVEVKVRELERESLPGDAATLSTTDRPVSPDVFATVQRVAAQTLSLQRDLGMESAWAVSANTTIRVVDQLGPLEMRLLAEGYREMATEDVLLAEADMAAGYEVLPPE